MLPNRHLILVVIVLLIAAVSASAQSQWLESKSAHYTVFYQVGFEKDSAIIRTWLDQIEKFMKSKYKVTPDHYHISIYLLPAPEGRISINQSGENECCTRGPNGIQTGTIRLLTMSNLTVGGLRVIRLIPKVVLLVECCRSTAQGTRSK
jgi:hypothetical protein